MDFVVRPQSKIDPEEVRARAKQIAVDERRVKVSFLPTRIMEVFFVLFFPSRSSISI